MRILVTGSREFADESVIMKALTDFWWPPLEIPVLVHGGARGADRLAAVAAGKLGWTVEEHRADWDRWAKRAGVMRNQQMVNLGADVCLAFFQSGAENKGTRDCVQRAEDAGILVRTFWSAPAR